VEYECIERNKNNTCYEYYWFRKINLIIYLFKNVRVIVNLKKKPNSKERFEKHVKHCDDTFKRNIYVW
jgi:hypothetical protein